MGLSGLLAACVRWTGPKIGGSCHASSAAACMADSLHTPAPVEETLHVLETVLCRLFHRRRLGFCRRCNRTRLHTCMFSRFDRLNVLVRSFGHAHLS